MTISARNHRRGKHIELSRGAAYHLRKHPDIIALLHNFDANPFTANQIVEELHCTVYEAISITRKLVSYRILERGGYADKRNRVLTYQVSLQAKLWIDNEYSGSFCQTADAAESAEGVL